MNALTTSAWLGGGHSRMALHESTAIFNCGHVCMALAGHRDLPFQYLSNAWHPEDYACVADLPQHDL